MKRQTAIQTQKETISPQKKGLFPHAAVRKAPDHDMRSNGLSETHFDHDFSRVAVHPSASVVSQDYSKTSCPMFPQRCPFGGACHTCPPRVRAKMKIGQIGDKYETKADPVADQIMRMPEPSHFAENQGVPKKTTGKIKDNSTSTSQRCCNNTKSSAGSLPLDALEQLLPNAGKERASFLGQMFSDKAIGVEGNWLSNNLSVGSPLEPHLRSEMEEKFGEDFSEVRVHTDDRAGLIADTLNAQAITIGQNIAFSSGYFNSHTKSGRELIVHELAHTIQQKGVTSIPSQIVPITQPGHSTEREARNVVRATNGSTKILNTVSTKPQVNRGACRSFVSASCWAFFTAIAAAIAALCTIGSVITVGGLAIPCTAIVIASAGLAAWDASMCSDVLGDAICGKSSTTTSSSAPSPSSTSTPSGVASG